MYFHALKKLILRIEKEKYLGYDPYDALCSWIPFHFFGKVGQIGAIQIQKRLPINIRPFIGIQKGVNPKAIGLFLRSYSILNKITSSIEYNFIINKLFEWLVNNSSKGYSGICWGYNFPWVTKEKIICPYIPSSVVTGVVIKGIWEYFQVSRDTLAIDIINSAANFLINDLERTSDETGQCISYTPIKKDICYNASLLAGEVIAMSYFFTKRDELKKLCIDLINFVVERQKLDGHWNYSQNILNGKERVQIDFHQGYILESIFNIQNLLQISNNSWNISLIKGLKYYHKNQFTSNGRSYWRLPKEYPVDIHNQSQGIITFSRLYTPHCDYRLFAKTIAKWTIVNMQDSNGNFYYRKYRLYVNKISYIRWSQAWMMTALSELLLSCQEK